MKRFRLLSRLLSAGMLSAMVGTLAAQVAQAQRPISFLDLQCVTRSGGYGAASEDISVGRQLYTSNWRILANTALTCRLPGGRASLRFEFAIPDTENDSPVQIDVYVDGNQVASRTGGKGKVHTMLVDISNGKSLAVEVSCARATSCNRAYYFMKAQIEPGAQSPGSR